MKRKNVNQKSLEQKQIRAFVFLGFALIYFILGQAVVAKYETFPVARACNYNSSNKVIESENGGQVKIDSLETGILVDQKRHTFEAKNYFNGKDSQINLRVDVSDPKQGEEISCYFYYMGNDDFSKPFLVGSEKKTMIGKESRETLEFKLHSTGNEWQLKGNFRAIISVPSENIKEEKDFSIL